MASINGVSIVNLKTFKGHEGEECLQGDIKLNGKKLGFWTQDSWGGVDIFHFDESLLDEACENFKAGFPDDYKYKDFCDDKGIFLNSLANLKLTEKDLAKGFKKGHKSAIHVSDGFHFSWIWLPDDDTDEALLKKYDKYVEDMKKPMFSNSAKVVVFRPNSFEMTVDKDHSACEFFMD